MRDRRPPSSLIWLAGLVAMTFAAAILAGAIMYLQTKRAAQVRASATARGNVERGRLAIVNYGCGGCHQVPGIDGALGQVGPDLRHVARRMTLAGQYPNQPEVMVRWLQHPQRLRPGSGMPEMGVREQDARDMAAYLYSRN